MAEIEEKILISTQFKKDGFVASCIVDNEALQSQAKILPHMATTSLINFVVEMKAEDKKVRNIDYVFVAKLK